MVVGKFSVKTVLNFLKISIAFVGVYSTYLLFSANSTHKHAESVEIEELDETVPSYKSVTFTHRSPRQFFLSGREHMSTFISRSMTQDTVCLNVGTKYMLYKECKCRDGWHGKSCSIPDCLYYSYRRHSMTSAEKKLIFLRKKIARRIIYAALFNHEFDMLEALLNEHFDLVDVFIILESSYTAFGTRKPLRLLPRLNHGYLRKFHSKLMYLYNGHFPTGGRKKGWKVDSYFRSLLGKKGLIHIHNLRDDDLFVVLDIDEIPSYDSLAFLKFYGGYPEPFGLRLRYSMFGYFWKNKQYTQVTIGCSVGMLKTVYQNDSNAIRDIEHGLNSTIYPSLKKYSENHKVRPWFLGDSTYYAGWHCSGCFNPEGIRIKFMSAQNADYPRWGSIPGKMDLGYIKQLVKEGRWFDGGRVPSSDLQSDQFFAPKHFLRNQDKYRHLLYNPYLESSDKQRVLKNLDHKFD